MGLAEVAKQMSLVDNYFPYGTEGEQNMGASQLPTPPVKPYTPDPYMDPYSMLKEYSQKPLAQPDMNAAKKRTSSSLGSIMAMLPLFMIGGNKKRNLGAFAQGFAKSLNRERESQEGIEYWKANQQNKRNEAKRQELNARILANQKKMDKLFDLDPGLYTDKYFMELYQYGSFDGVAEYLAKKGWKPVEDPQSAKDKVMDSIWQKFQVDPRTLSTQEAKLIGAYVAPPKPKSPSYRLIKTNDGYARMNMATGEVLPTDVQPEEKSPTYRLVKTNNGYARMNMATGEVLPTDVQPEEKSPTRSDLDSVYRMILGSADALNPFKGFANMYDSPEELKTAIKLQYGKNQALYDHAIGLAFSSPQSKFYGQSPSVNSVSSISQEKSPAISKNLQVPSRLIQEVKARISSQLSYNDLPETIFAKAYNEAEKSNNPQLFEAVKIAIQQLRE